MKYISFTFAFALLASVANAATVEYALYLDGAPGTYRLTAKASAGDNEGIASYGVALNGVATAVNSTPNTTDLTTFTPRGFSLLRSSDAASVNAITGSQDTIQGLPATFLYGIGQTAGTWAANNITPGGPATKPNATGWESEVLIATGTYTGAKPSFNTQSADFATNVFTSRTASAVASATQTTRIVDVVIPEPATFVLAGMGLIGFVAYRRRKA